MSNLNADFLLDIWADLKAKRLAPVAVGLAVMLVAMPALMLKGDDAGSEGPLPIVAPVDAGGAKVDVSDELAGRKSKLDSYRARDPFKGLVKPKADATSGSGTATAPGVVGTNPGEAPSGLPAPTSSSAPATGPSGGGGSGGSGAPSGSAERPPPVVGKRRQSRYNYQLELKFGRPGREKHYGAVSRLTFLPSASLPVALFMGVPEAAKSAIFFVHPGLNHQGEGRCIPRPTNCDFLELGVGREHYFSANDYEFRMHLLDIKRVSLSREKKQAAAARRATQGRRSGRTNGDATCLGSPGAQDTQPELPWLVDGVG